MALIGKIREKAGWAVIVIAVSMLLFIVGGELMQSNFFSSNDNHIGEIAGKKIKYEEYSALVDEYKAFFEAGNGRGATEYDMQQIRQRAWEKLIADNAYSKEYEALGLEITAEEEVDVVQGKNMDPMLKQYFGDQNGIKQFLRAIKAGQEQRPAVIAWWVEYERNIKPQRLRNKYENLLRKTDYVTKAEAKRDYIANNQKADFKFLYVPFWAIADSTIKPTDDQLKEYLAKNKAMFKVDDKVTLEYVSFPVVPSAKDSADFQSVLSKLAADFKTTTDDSAFVKANTESGVLPSYMKEEQVPVALKNIGLKKDSVVGPLIEGGQYKFYKISKTKDEASIKASHILIKTAATDAPAVKAAAKAKAEQILAELKAGGNFEEIAKTKSEDPGSGANGGDLGEFGEKQMVKPFSDAVFGHSGTGLIPRLVESDFGFHIIKVTQAKKSVKTYFVASVDRILDASNETSDMVYQKALDFASKSATATALTENSKKQNLQLMTADNVLKNAEYVNGLSGVRRMVRWAFDEAELNQVSKEVFDCNKNYVVVSVKKKVEKDDFSVENLRDELTAKVREELKAKQILEKINKTKGTFEQIAAAYGQGAQVNVSLENVFARPEIAAMGSDPIAVGKGFGLAKVGDKTQAFVGKSSVVALELLKKSPAPAEIADYSQYKNNLIMMQSYRAGMGIDETIKDNSKILDNRYKFF